MKQATRHHSHLFLLEITLAILFFSLASAVCLRCFAKSHILSQQATELNQAVSQTENVAELLRSLPENNRTNADRITERLQEEYPMIEQVAAGQWILYFDGDWNSCEKSQAVYQMQIVGTRNSDSRDSGNVELSMVVFQLTVYTSDNDINIYQLELKLYAKES